MQEFFGVSLSPVPIEQLVAEIADGSLPQGSGPRMVFTINLDHVVKLRENEQFRSAYDNASVVTADGTPVYVYARLRGAEVSRITGSDLFARLMPRLDPYAHRCFFVVSERRLGEGMVADLCERGFARDRIAYRVPRARVRAQRSRIRRAGGRHRRLRADASVLLSRRAEIGDLVP